MEQVTYEYRYVPLDRLTLVENNPRYIEEENFHRLKESLRDDPEMLFPRPLMVSKRYNGTLLALGGNMRYRAARELGWKEIYCCVLTGLSAAKEKALMMKDNAHEGRWDFDRLANEWALDLDIDLVKCGIPAEQIEGFKLFDTEDKAERTVSLSVEVPESMSENAEMLLREALKSIPQEKYKIKRRLKKK